MEGKKEGGEGGEEGRKVRRGGREGKIGVRSLMIGIERDWRNGWVRGGLRWSWKERRFFLEVGLTENKDADYEHEPRDR